jgi:hypothetical protein
MTALAQASIPPRTQGRGREERRLFNGGIPDPRIPHCTESAKSCPALSKERRRFGVIRVRLAALHACVKDDGPIARAPSFDMVWADFQIPVLEKAVEVVHDTHFVPAVVPVTGEAAWTGVRERTV